MTGSRFACALLAAALLLTACAAPAPQESQTPPPSQSQPAAPPLESVPVPGGTAPRIPLNTYFTIWRFADPLPDNMMPQLVCKDETSARLALIIGQLMCDGVQTGVKKVGLPFFDEETPLDTASTLTIALRNTQSIALGGSYTTENGYTNSDYPDHPITARIAQLWSNGENPTDVYYAEDVAATLERLFDVTGIDHRPVAWHHYFPEEGIYVAFGDPTWHGDYPQILSCQETADGYSCEVILTDALFGTIDGQKVTEENIEEMAEKVPHYLFTFRMADEGPVVTSFTQKPAIPIVGQTRQDADFLTDEQWALYDKGRQYLCYFLFDAGYFYDDTNSAEHVVKMIDGRGYYPYVGKKYPNYDAFYKEMLSVFTLGFYEERNKTPTENAVPIYVNVDGGLYYLDATGGANITYLSRWDRFELVSKADDRIEFNLVAYYCDYDDVQNPCPTPVKTKRGPIVLEKTGDGWRISKFDYPN